jgi:hypothetical protein
MSTEPKEVHDTKIVKVLVDLNRLVNQVRQEQADFRKEVTERDEDLRAFIREEIQSIRAGLK